jgi:hypothetical protein
VKLRARSLLPHLNREIKLVQESIKAAKNYQVKRREDAAERNQMNLIKQISVI